MALYTDIADEIYGPERGRVPAGVKMYTARSGPIALTRVLITRQGLERPAGRSKIFYQNNIDKFEYSNIMIS